MPHKLQLHLPEADAQPLFLGARVAVAGFAPRGVTRLREIPVKQKLKLHHASLKSRAVKTISHCLLQKSAWSTGA